MTQAVNSTMYGLRFSKYYGSLIWNLRRIHIKWVISHRDLKGMPEKLSGPTCTFSLCTALFWVYFHNLCFLYLCSPVYILVLEGLCTVMLVIFMLYHFCVYHFMFVYSDDVMLWPDERVQFIHLWHVVPRFSWHDISCHWCIVHQDKHPAIEKETGRVWLNRQTYFYHSGT